MLVRVGFWLWLYIVGFWVGFRVAEFQLWLARGRFQTMVARAELVEAGLASGLARTGFRAQFTTARLGAAFCRAGFWKNI